MNILSIFTSKRFALLLTLLAITATILGGRYVPAAHAQDSMNGQWLIDPSGKADMVQLTLQKRDGWEHQFSSSFPVPMSDLRGLSSAQMGASGATVRFEIRRDAGSFMCEGWFNNGRGAGQFTFAANQSYLSELRGLGYKSVDDRILSLAVHDVSLKFIQDLQSLGYEHLSLDQLVAMRIHGVSTDFIKELNNLGYNHIFPDNLVAMRIHGVRTEWISELKTLGYDHISVDQLVAMRIHGVSTEFIKEWKDLGYEIPSTDELVAMRIHGVKAEFVKELKDLGYDHVSADQLVSMRIHGEIGRA